jgi:hypothetical protein
VENSPVGIFDHGHVAAERVNTTTEDRNRDAWLSEKEKQKKMKAKSGAWPHATIVGPEGPRKGQDKDRHRNSSNEPSHNKTQKPELFLLEKYNLTKSSIECNNQERIQTLTQNLRDLQGERTYNNYHLHCNSIPTTAPVLYTNTITSLG